MNCIMKALQILKVLIQFNMELQNPVIAMTIIYHKIPVISPGLIQLRKGFWVGL